MAYVACGRLDAAFQKGSWGTWGPKIWDFAAGRLLVEEAGGQTRDISGVLPTEQPLDLLGRSQFCGATKPLIDEMLEAIIEGRTAEAAKFGSPLPPKPGPMLQRP